MHIKSICAVTNPLVNSYKRLLPGGQEAPSLVGWSCNQKGTLIRAPASVGLGSRVDLRSPDPTCNPYLAFALLLSAGIDGIDRDLLPPPAVVSAHPFEEKPAAPETLPSDLGEAVQLMKNDPFVKEVLGDLVFYKYVEAKEEEWRQYSNSVTDWELRRYLNRL
jgi:glutamine synthetase